MNTEEFTDLCRATGDAISSLRSCQESERPAEAKRVRKWVAELEEASLPKIYPHLVSLRCTILELADWVLTADATEIHWQNGQRYYIDIRSKAGFKLRKDYELGNKTAEARLD